MKTIELHPSRFHIMLNVGVHFFVALIVLFSSLVFLYKFLILLLCIGSFCFADLKRQISASYTQLIFNHDVIQVRSTVDRAEEISLKGSVLSSPWLIVLNFDTLNADKITSRKNIVLVLFKDAMSDDAWRNLRVTLRILPSAEQKQ